MNDPTIADFDTLVARLSQTTPQDRRRVIAVAGPPGAGKSTLAEALVEALSDRVSGGAAALLPMDGFHYDNAVIEPKRLLAKKGAPETFDFDGYRAMLARLRHEPDRAIAVPVFDRALDLARGSATIIAPEQNVIVTEGNYLLLKDDPWPQLRDLFDVTVLLSAPEGLLRRRLVDRWLAHGLNQTDAERRAGGNDMTNARLVLNSSRQADIVYAPFG